MLTTRTRAAKIAWSLAIVVAAASTGILVDWQPPGIGRYTRDWLMRARGPLPVPEDIAVVAIDEPSMARFGRFPWSRQVVVVFLRGGVGEEDLDRHHPGVSGGQAG